MQIDQRDHRLNYRELADEPVASSEGSPKVNQSEPWTNQSVEAVPFRSKGERIQNLVRLTVANNMNQIASPVHYTKHKLRPGGVKTSIFSLIILCLGAGTLTIPYVFYANGIVVGTLLVLLGAAVSYYTGWLIIICAEQLNGNRYEDLASKTYGRRCSIFSSVMIVLCMMGFVISNIVLVSRKEV